MEKIYVIKVGKSAISYEYKKGIYKVIQDKELLFESEDNAEAFEEFLAYVNDEMLRYCRDDIYREEQLIS